MTVEVAESSPVLVNAGGSGVYRTSYGAAELGRPRRTPRRARRPRAHDPRRRHLGAAVLRAGPPGPSSSRWPRDSATRTSPRPGRTVATALDYVDRALLPETARPDRRRDRARSSPRSGTRLGWDPRASESELAAQMRAVVLGVLGTTGRDEAVIDGAIERFEAETNWSATSPGRSSASSPPTATRATTRPSSSATAPPRTPRSEQRYLRALAVFGDPRPGPQHRGDVLQRGPLPRQPQRAGRPDGCPHAPHHAHRQPRERPRRLALRGRRAGTTRSSSSRRTCCRA